MPTTYAIPDGRTVMNAVTYTGTAAVLDVATTCSPDFFWAKSRSNAVNNGLFDSQRGYELLISNSTAAGAFSVDAYNLGDGSNRVTVANYSGTTDQSGYTYVGWYWKAGGATGVSNTAGSITSSVSANTTAGFSVVTYTGTGVTATIGHGLGVAPQMVIVKNRAAAESWRVGHSFMNSGSSPWSYYMNLNGTGAQVLEASIWNNTAPTSSVFTISNDSAVSGNGQSHVAYCFAPVAGYSAFGYYTGNSSADGPFLYTGFRPRWVMLKVASGQTGEWLILDTSRDTYNTASHLLYANSSAAEDYPGGYIVDILSNGFKLRNSSFGFNNTSGTYIWAAFAESPFKYANAR
jgi:hypothetical protein